MKRDANAKSVGLARKRREMLYARHLRLSVRPVAKWRIDLSAAKESKRDIDNVPHIPKAVGTCTPEDPGL